MIPFCRGVEMNPLSLERAGGWGGLVWANPMPYYYPILLGILGAECQLKLGWSSCSEKTKRKWKSSGGGLFFPIDCQG
jgi:hypothetical protein